MTEHDRIILLKMHQYCIEINQTHQFFNHDKGLFLDISNPSCVVYKNAITMPILQIGELAKHLSKEFIEQHLDIPWRSIMGMRDIFAHHYGSVRLADIWETSHQDIENLKDFIAGLLDRG